MAADDFRASASGLNLQSQKPISDGKDDVGGTGHKNRHAKPLRRRIRVLPPENLSPETAKGACDILDAAAFLVQVAGPLARAKLNDLLYFAQAWHLVWDHELLFRDAILATEDGVSIAAIDRLGGGAFTVEPRHVRKGRADRLGESQQRTLLGIVKFYSGRNHYRLSEQIRQETPWRQARQAAALGSTPTVEPAALHRYYRES